MKNKIITLLTALFIVINSVNVSANNISLKVNGEEIVCDTPPIIMNERTLVPVRAVAEALKCEVAWNEINRTVSIFDGNNLYLMWIDKDIAFKTNGAALIGTYQMDVTPKIIEGRTMVPIRCISELFGAKVDWIQDEYTVTVDYDNGERTAPEDYIEQLAPYAEAMTQQYDAYRRYVLSDSSSTVKAEIELENGGMIKLELYKDIAPLSVENFVKLANDKKYDGKIFHRVIKDFMIQGGAFDIQGSYSDAESITGEFIANNVFNLIPHMRGTISMARTNEPNSGSNQFFIVHADSPHLDGQYAAFGMVYEGMEYVDKIAECETDSEDKPIENQVIKTVRIISQ